MRATKIVGCVGLVCVGLMGVSGCAASGGAPTTQQTMERIKGLPGPAMLAVQREIGGGGVRSVNEEEFEGRTVYAVAFVTEAGKRGWLQVASDGRVLDRAVEVEQVKLAALPEAVRAAAMARTGGVAPLAITRENKGDAGSPVDVYNLQVVLAGADREYSFEQDGTLVKETGALAIPQLPVVVRAAITRRYPDISISGAKEVRESRGTPVYFAIKGKSGGKEVTATVRPDGSFRSSKVE